MNVIPAELALAQLSRRVELAQRNERRYRLATALRAQRRADRAAERARRLSAY